MKNQKVIVKLANYPYIEFGMLIGYIENISSIPDETGYLAEVNFPYKLTTSYKINLPYNNTYIGRAEIITDNLSFLSRILYPIRASINRQNILN